MTAFDTDVLSDVVRQNARVLARLVQVDPADRAVPVVVAGEVFRGWLGLIRKAEAGRGTATLEKVYANFALSIEATAGYQLLPYNAAADAQFRQWKAAKLRVGSQDLRIAAIVVANGATLVTRNARDYHLIPGLRLDVWV